MRRYRLLFMAALVMFVLVGCGKENSQTLTSDFNEAQTTDNSGRENSETTLWDSSVTTSSASNTYKSVQKDNILFLCAWQNPDYIDYGLPSHYMIYYIEQDGSSYSAFWETEDMSPDEAADHFEDFTDIRSLGTSGATVTGSSYSKFSEFRNQNLTHIETEQLDINIPSIWWYGYFKTDEGETMQKRFYQDGDTDYIIDSDDARYVVNELYAEPTFETARNIWTTEYYK